MPTLPQVDSASCVSAHVGGVVSLDARDSHVACCGYSLRAGVPTPEPYVKVNSAVGTTHALYLQSGEGISVSTCTALS